MAEKLYLVAEYSGDQILSLTTSPAAPQFAPLLQVCSPSPLGSS